MIICTKCTIKSGKLSTNRKWHERKKRRSKVSDFVNFVVDYLNLGKIEIELQNTHFLQRLQEEAKCQEERGVERQDPPQHHLKLEE